MGYPAQFIGDEMNFVGYVPYTKDESEQDKLEMRRDRNECTEDILTF